MDDFVNLVNATVQNKKTRKEKFNIIVNIIIALGFGIFFIYSMIVSCGAYFIAEVLACVLFIFLNIFYLQKTQVYTKAQMIGLVVACLTITVIGVIFMVLCVKQTLCDQLWCINSNTSNITILNDYTSANSNCNSMPSNLSGSLLNYTIRYYDSNADTIRGFDWGTFFVFELILAGFSLTFLLQIYIYSRLRKNIQKELGLLQGQENRA